MAEIVKWRIPVSPGSDALNGELLLALPPVGSPQCRFGAAPVPCPISTLGISLYSRDLIAAGSRLLVARTPAVRSLLCDTLC